MTRIRSPLEAQVAAESLGYAGLRLRRALDNLRNYDEGIVSKGAPTPAVRAALIAEAGEAFWRYVVQRELLGVRDPEYVAKEYGVPAEVWQSMGPKKSDAV